MSTNNAINAYKIVWDRQAYPPIPAAVELRAFTSKSLVNVVSGGVIQPEYVNRNDVTLELDLGINVQVLKLSFDFPGDVSDPSPIVQLSSILDKLAFDEGYLNPDEDYDNLIKDSLVSLLDERPGTLTPTEVEALLEENPPDLESTAVTAMGTETSTFIGNNFSESKVFSPGIGGAALDTVIDTVVNDPAYDAIESGLRSTLITDLQTSERAAYLSYYNGISLTPLITAISNIGGQSSNWDFSTASTELSAAFNDLLVDPSELSAEIWGILRKHLQIKAYADGLQPVHIRKPEVDGFGNRGVIGINLSSTTEGTATKTSSVPSGKDYAASWFFVYLLNYTTSPRYIEFIAKQGSSGLYNPAYDPYMYIYGPKSSSPTNPTEADLLYEDDDSGSGTRSRIRFVAHPPGGDSSIGYFVKVLDFLDSEEAVSVQLDVKVTTTP